MDDLTLMKSDFNSTMVRLRVAPRLIVTSIFIAFQFHYGAIKGTGSQQLGKPEYEFQFHYGAIKGIERSVERNLIPSFQFHYGAIKGTSWVSSPGGRTEFQFHYGAIKGIAGNTSSADDKNISIPLWCD